MITKIIKDLETKFQVKRQNNIASILIDHADIDCFVETEKIADILSYLKQYNVIFKNAQDRSIAVYLFDKGLLYEIDLIYNHQALLQYFKNVYFTEVCIEEINRDIDLEKWLRYVLQLRSHKPKYFDITTQHYPMYHKYLQDKKYISRPLLKDSVSIKNITSAQKKKLNGLFCTFYFCDFINLLIVFCKRKIAKIGSGKIIAFVGSDGAGKTTAITATTYICHARTILFGDGTHVLKKFYQWTDTLPLYLARIKYIGIFIEQWCIYLYLLYLKYKGETIFTDRWPGTNRHLRHKNNLVGINNLLYTLFPNPDLFIFLSANPVNINARKPELTVEEITILQENLRNRIADHCFIEIKTENLDQSLTEILRNILLLQKEAIITHL